MNIVIEYESSALAAPQSFRNAMQTAANLLDAAIYDNITVNILVGYGDFDNGAYAVAANESVGDSMAGLGYTYPELRSYLAAHETSAVQQSVVNALPNTSTLGNTYVGYEFYVPNAIGKALGLVPANSTAVDGAVGMGTGIPANLMVGVALHELTHAMGRVPSSGPFDFVRYTSPGNHLISDADTATAAYFSIDGGYTRIADFGQMSDASDFLGPQAFPAGGPTSNLTPNDPFDEFVVETTAQTLTSVDLTTMNALGFNTSGTPVVVQTDGSTTLVKIGNYASLSPNGGATLGTLLSYNGVAVNLAQFGNVAPVGAIQTTGGYLVAWKVGGADQFTIWNTDSNGNYVSSVSAGVLSGTSLTLQSYESVFHQDLNGDGTIGVPTSVTETFGATSLTKVANQYYLDDHTGSGPSLKYAGAAYTAGEFGKVAPIGAEQVAGGYEVAWKVGGADQYTIWNTDSNGNYVSSVTAGVLSGASFTLESYESIFQQDLNGDGRIGVTTSVIESSGTISLTQVADQYYLYDGSGSGPSLKYARAAYTAGEFGNVAPIGAEHMGDNYVVAWKVGGADQYTIWNVNGNGEYDSSVTGGVLSGSSVTLEAYETTFHQDLNGDGTIGVTAGVATSVIESHGSTSLTQVGNQYYLYDPTGAGPALQIGGAPVVTGEFGNIAPIAGEQLSSSFYDVIWKVPGADQYTIWLADVTGNYVYSVSTGVLSGNSTQLEQEEFFLQQDVNGDGTIGIASMPIESAGSFSLSEEGNNFFVSNGHGTFAVLKIGGAPVTAGEFGAIAPIGAEQTAGGGYVVAWKVAGADQYTIWNTDSSGNYVSSATTGVLSGTSATLESYETAFHQDLNGDGVIGLAVGAGATLELSGAQSGAVTFLGSTGTLKLDAPSTFTGPITGFTGDGTLSGSDHVDLTTLAFNSLVAADSSYDGSTHLLQVSNGTTTQVLQFLGSYTLANFKFASDGNGGTIVYDPPATVDVTDHRTLTNDGTVNVANHSAVTIAAGAGADNFVFAANFGQANVTGFKPGTDTVQFDRAAFASVDALFAATHDDAQGNAVISDAAHDTLTLTHVTTAQLMAHQADFHLV